MKYFSLTFCWPRASSLKGRIYCGVQSSNLSSWMDDKLIIISALAQFFYIHWIVTRCRGIITRSNGTLSARDEISVPVGVKEARLWLAAGQVHLYIISLLYLLGASEISTSVRAHHVDNNYPAGVIQEVVGIHFNGWLTNGFLFTTNLSRHLQLP